MVLQWLKDAKEALAALAVIGGALIYVWQFQPFALADQLEDIEIKMAANLEEIVERLSSAVAQNSLDIAEGNVREYSKESDAIQLDIIRTENRTDLSPADKNAYLRLLREKQRAVSGQLEQNRSRARALRPVFPERTGQ